jgi:hypothetical protein
MYDYTLAISSGEAAKDEKVTIVYGDKAAEKARFYASPSTYCPLMPIKDIKAICSTWSFGSYQLPLMTNH